MKTLSALLFCLTLPLLSRAGVCAQALAEVKLLEKGVQPWVLADIGQHRNVQCIVDTGSSDSGVLPTRYAQKATYLRPADIMTANGLVKMPKVSIDSVAIGSVKQINVPFYLRDQSWFHSGEPMPCILGMEFLSHYTVDLDGSHGILRLYARGTRLEDVLGHPLPIGARLDATVRIGSVIGLDATVNGINVRSTIDTGWGLATPNRSLLDALGIHPDDARIVAQSAKSVLSDREITLHIIELARVQLGSLTENNVRASIDENGMRVISQTRTPYLHIGWDLLHRHRLLLDVAHREIALLP